MSRTSRRNRLLSKSLATVAAIFRNYSPVDMIGLLSSLVVFGTCIYLVYFEENLAGGIILFAETIMAFALSDRVDRIKSKLSEYERRLRDLGELEDD